MSCSALSCRPSYPTCLSPSLDFSFLFLDFSVSRSLRFFLLSLPLPSLHPPSSLLFPSSPPPFLIAGGRGEKQPPSRMVVHPARAILPKFSLVHNPPSAILGVSRPLS